jgi:hypothetical protein
VLCRVSFKAIIDNHCPECTWGDLDFRGAGNGRWPLTWWVVPCPSTGISVTRENGNKFYSKLKVEGGLGPATAMSCGGMNGQRTSDGFFEFQDKSGTMCAGTSCSVTFSSGASQDVNVSREQLGGFC